MQFILSEKEHDNLVSKDKIKEAYFELVIQLRKNIELRKDYLENNYYAVDYNKIFEIVNKFRENLCIS